MIEQGKPSLTVEWRGSNPRTVLRRDTYDAINKAIGDPISNAGVHDGYVLPGANINGVSLGNPTGGSANGLAAEAALPWANLGIPAGSPMTIHVSSTKANSGLAP